MHFDIGICERRKSFVTLEIVNPGSDPESWLCRLYTSGLSVSTLYLSTFCVHFLSPTLNSQTYNIPLWSIVLNKVLWRYASSFSMKNKFPQKRNNYLWNGPPPVMWNCRFEVFFRICHLSFSLVFCHKTFWKFCNLMRLFRYWNRH